MGRMSVSSCRCCMLVTRVHPVADLNAAFCMTCRLLTLVEDHIEEAYSRPDYLIGSHECIRLVTPSCCCECFCHL